MTLIRPSINFGDVYIINLPERTDRKMQIQQELIYVGFNLDDPRINFVNACRPTSKAGFPSIGARGCFESHKAVLEKISASDSAFSLILEDDALMTKRLKNMYIDSHDFGGADIIYLGYRAENSNRIAHLKSSDCRFLGIPSDLRLQTSHAMVIRRNAAHILVNHLNAIASRPPGSVEGGPMHVDGAYNWVREKNPELTTVISKHQLIKQRSSFSNISGQSHMNTKLIGRASLIDLLLRYDLL